MTQSNPRSRQQLGLSQPPPKKENTHGWGSGRGFLLFLGEPALRICSDLVCYPFVPGIFHIPAPEVHAKRSNQPIDRTGHTSPTSSCTISAAPRQFLPISRNTALSIIFIPPDTYSLYTLELRSRRCVQHLISTTRLSDPPLLLCLSISGPETAPHPERACKMVKENVTIAIIIIVLFVVLALAGFGIYAVQNRMSFFSRRRAVDEESGED